jgi:hypothetical protein
MSALSVAGGLSTCGYRRINIDRRLYQAHRLAWLYVHGRWPIVELDHINGVRDDNRLANLREATRAQNNQNLSQRSDNKSGHVGASFHKQTRRWKAQIQVGGQTRHLGLYATPEAAHDAYLAAKAEMHTFQPALRAVA